MHPPMQRSRGSGFALRKRVRTRGGCARGRSQREAVPDSRFTIATERLAADGAAVRLAGELDLAAVPALEEALRRVERWPVSSVLVDAAGVGFVDVTVIGRLAAAHQRLGAEGGGLFIVHPPDCLLRMLEVLDRVELPIVS